MDERTDGYDGSTMCFYLQMCNCVEMRKNITNIVQNYKLLGNFGLHLITLINMK